MEKRISLILYLLLPIIFLSFRTKPSPLALYAQNLSQNQGETIRFSLWALVDPIPATDEEVLDPNNPLLLPVTKLKSLAPFIVSGMVYGWRFSYTPSDKLRGVSEYFEFNTIQEISVSDNNFTYKEPWFENNQLKCWVEYRRSATMMQNRKYWDSIKFPKIMGKGQGNVSDGVDGVKEAYGDAIKNAVRTYVQTIVKNKPKEINGTVLLTDVPSHSIDGGRYVAHLDFFLDVDTIVPYSQF